MSTQVSCTWQTARARSFDHVYSRTEVVSFDNTPLVAFQAGHGPDAIVLASACGMPGSLVEGWMRYLATDHTVITWESRGLSEVSASPATSSSYATDAEAQARDMFAVMDHFGIQSAHMVGLCGGAVVALIGAAIQPRRVHSLNLWHGAYHSPDAEARTPFQDDLIDLMSISVKSPRAAASVQAAFLRTTQRSIPDSLSHLLLYPYSNSELFYRYCQVNGKLATTDIYPYAKNVTQPTQVVSSPDDITASPEGSRILADALPNGRLLMRSMGQHADLFQNEERFLSAALDFIHSPSIATSSSAVPPGGSNCASD